METLVFTLILVPNHLIPIWKTDAKNNVVSLFIIIDLKNFFLTYNALLM